MGKVMVALAVGALLLILPLSATGCCGADKTVTVVLDHRLDQPVVAVYSVQVNRPEGLSEKWATKDQHQLVGPHTTTSLFTYTMVESAGDMYYVSIVGEDGATICEKTFRHAEVVYHESNKHRSTLTIVVPDCSMSREAKPAPTAGKLLGSKCGR